MNHNTWLLLLLVSSQALGDAIADPWSELPEWTNACYRDADDFMIRLDDTEAELAAAEARQTGINQAIDAGLRNMDISEQQERMMTFMMEHPDQAQEYMQAVARLGQGSVDVIATMSEDRMQLSSEFEELAGRYDATLEESLVPSQASYRAWIDRFFEEKAPESEGRMLLGEVNAAYEAVCADWWQPGPFHEYLARLKQVLAAEATRNDDSVPELLKTYEIMGISSQGHRSTGAIRAALEYLRQARFVYGKRWAAPLQYSRPI